MKDEMTTRQGPLERKVRRDGDVLRFITRHAAMYETGCAVGEIVEILGIQREDVEESLSQLKKDGLIDERWHNRHETMMYLPA